MIEVGGRLVDLERVQLKAEALRELARRGGPVGT
jgi:hypothetical protein